MISTQATTDVLRVAKSVVVVVAAQLFNAKVTLCQMYANTESVAWPGLGWTGLCSLHVKRWRCPT